MIIESICYFYLFISIKTQITSTFPCGKGCLSCIKKGDSYECNLPDSMMHYYLFQTTVSRNEIGNCWISFENGRCEQCEFDYYLSNDFKCLKFPSVTKLRIENCLNHKKPEECLACDLRTSLENGYCRFNKITIDNCT